MKKLRFIIAIALILMLSSGTAYAAAGTWMYGQGGWWYQNADNSYPCNTWQLIDGSWYHFDAVGYMQTGWIFDGGSWYYLYGNGKMATGWILDSGSWYYLYANGIMATGWVYDNGIWYYCNDNGSMSTGWLYWGGTWYYLYENGAMAQGSAMINGTEYFFNADGSLREEGEKTDPASFKAGSVLTYQEVSGIGEDSFFYVEEISDQTFERMWGKSFKENCTTPREELRYIRCLHKDINGNIKAGELVMHRSVAYTVCEIFRQLYLADYPIESMLLVDEFDASDDDSIMANNTSAFNYRTVDDTDQISYHAYGLAIDINPYYNVYYIPSEDYIFPPEGWAYLDRDKDFPYKLQPFDLCYELFTQAGFEWGGWWTYNTDYQHFQYTGG